MPGGNVLTPPKPTLAKTYQTGSVLKLNRWTLDVDAYYVHFQNGYDSYTDPTTLRAGVRRRPVLPIPRALRPKAMSRSATDSACTSTLSVGSAKYQTGPNYPNGGEWVANTPSNIEGVSLLWQHQNWDVGLIDKRVGQYYNDNGTLNYMINGVKIPYPVDQAITIHPWDLVNVFFNYTIKNSSFLRGSKIQFAVNNLANSHNIVGITPAIAATAAAPYVPNGGDLLNLLPGRSFTITLTGGYAPKR